jgi:ribosomal protein S18 acetylase RimI-like enzyme
MITIRPYNSEDIPWLEESMGLFQDGLIASDVDGVLRKSEDLAKRHMERAIERVSKESGAFFVAEENGNQIGFVAGIIQFLNEVERLGSVNDRYGEVIELYVVEEYRGTDTATMLMNELEIFFKENECPFVFLEVFAFNGRAKKFYEKVGYHERDYVMMKKL